MLPRNLRLSVYVHYTLSAHILLSGKCQVPLTIGKCLRLMRTTVLTDLWLLRLHVNGKDIIVLTSVTRPTCLLARDCSKPLKFWWPVRDTFVLSFIWSYSATTKQAQPISSLISQALASFIVHAPKMISPLTIWVYLFMGERSRRLLLI